MPSRQPRGSKTKPAPVKRAPTTKSGDARSAARRQPARGGPARPYVKIVEWSPEDGCFVGSAPPLVGRCCHGDREDEVFTQLSQIVEEWLAIHAADGTALPADVATRRYSGKFQLRLGSDLHRLLALRAAVSRKSINDLAVEAIRGALVPGG